MLLASKVPAPASGQITALNLPGVYQSASYARSYPEGSAAANLIGFTNVNARSNAISGQAASRCRSATASRSRCPAARAPRR